MVKAERYEMKPLFGGVCKCQKWGENAYQTQLKPIIWYTSWYFSRGGGEILGGGKKIKKNYPPPSLFTPLGLSKKTWGIYGGILKGLAHARHAQCFGILKKLTFKQEELTVHFFTMPNLVILLLT